MAVSSSSSSTMLSVLECTAQELFRVLLFLVFTVEVFLISFIPYVGKWGGSATVALLLTLLVVRFVVP